MTDKEKELQAEAIGYYRKRISELEKENAELKELLEACKQERVEALFRNAQYIKENAELKAKAEKYYWMLEKSMDCETCKYYASVDENLEPCNSCFFDNSQWEIKEDD